MERIISLDLTGLLGEASEILQEMHWETSHSVQDGGIIQRPKKVNVRPREFLSLAMSLA